MADKPEPVRDHFTQGESGTYTAETAKRRANAVATESGAPKPGTPTEPEPPAEPQA